MIVKTFFTFLFRTKRKMENEKIFNLLIKSKVTYELETLSSTVINDSNKLWEDSSIIQKEFKELQKNEFISNWKLDELNFEFNYEELPNLIEEYDLKSLEVIFYHLKNNFLNLTILNYNLKLIQKKHYFIEYLIENDETLSILLKKAIVFYLINDW